jgi:hypothetical protein
MNNRVIGLALLAVGVALLVMGMSASDEFGEQFLKTFTGHFSDKTNWFILGGVAGIVAGGAMASLGGGSKHA